MSKKRPIEAELPENKKAKVDETKPPYLLLKNKDRHFVIDQKDLPESGMLRTLYDNFKETGPVEIKEGFKSDLVEYVFKHLKQKDMRLESQRIVSLKGYEQIRKICEFFGVNQEKVCQNVELHPIFKNIYNFVGAKRRQRRVISEAGQPEWNIAFFYCCTLHYNKILLDIQFVCDDHKNLWRLCGVEEFIYYKDKEKSNGKYCSIGINLAKYFMNIHFLEAGGAEYYLYKMIKDSTKGKLIITGFLHASSRDYDFESDPIKICSKGFPNE